MSPETLVFSKSTPNSEFTVYIKSRRDWNDSRSVGELPELVRILEEAATELRKVIR